MSGVHNQNPAFGAAPLPRLMQPYGGAVPAAPAPAALPTDQFAPSAADAGQLAALRQQLRMGSPVDAAMALYQLEALASTHSAHVVPLLLEQLGAGGTNARAALDILARLKPPEAAPHLQAMMQSASEPGLRNAAASAYHAIAGPPPVPAAPATPGAAPATPATPASTGLMARLLSPASAPGAVVELAKLPTPQLIAITDRLLKDFLPDPKTLDLLTTVLSKRVREPGVAEQLQLVLRKPRTDAPGAYGKAAIALSSLRNPAYVPDIMRAIATRNPALNPVKRALIDFLARSPEALAHPAMGAVLGAVLKANEAPALAASASHALAQVKTAAARDALADSPLFHAIDAQSRLRALADLGAHPAPYPPTAQAHLQRLAADANPQVAAQAKALLQKRQ
jgi:hypothetical protein